MDSDGLATAQRRTALWVSLLFQWMQGADVLKCGALQSSNPAAQHMGQGCGLIYRAQADRGLSCSGLDEALRLLSSSLLYETIWAPMK